MSGELLCCGFSCVDRPDMCIGWENNSAWFSVKGGKWQDYGDQRSNQSPAVRAESRESGSGGGGEFDGKRYRKVLLHAAYGTLSCEGGKRQLSIFQFHSSWDPSHHLHYLGLSLCARLFFYICEDQNCSQRRIWPALWAHFWAYGLT